MRAYVIKKKKKKKATICDGEVAGLEQGLVSLGEHPRVVLLSDLTAALQAIRTTGKTGKTRTRRLSALVTEIKQKKDLYDTCAVRLVCVKAHIGIMGNEGADSAAKVGTIMNSQAEMDRDRI